MDNLLRAIEMARSALTANSTSHWVLGFSGGKDSTALLKVLASAATKVKRPPIIDLIYCDTGVENPVLDRYVKNLLQRLKREFLRTSLPFRVHVLKAPVENRFFVKVIGRGYPPPTNSFRWCTSNLRIRPVSRFIAAASEKDAIVTLGMRQSESQQRDRSLSASGGGVWQEQREGSKSYRLFLPILNLNLEEVWDAVFSLPRPTSIVPHELETLYRGASGECPIVKAPQAAPCASGRFGCWTCTVVRRDKSSEALIRSGNHTLQPYLEFRNWLADIRNDSRRRWARRRNGSSGLGAFSLSTRKEIMVRLRALEQRTGTEIISEAETCEIERLWRLDTETPPLLTYEFI